MNLKTFIRQRRKRQKPNPAALVAVAVALAVKAGKGLRTQVLGGVVNCERRDSNIVPARVANLRRLQFSAVCRFRI